MTLSLTGWGRMLAAGMMAMMVLGLVPEAHAQQTAPVVLYSYTKLAMGNDVQYVLVPAVSRKLKLAQGTPLSPAVVNGVFNELRDRKRTTYGDTSMEVNTRSLAKGQATVKLDKSRQKYHVIITAEIVFTMTQLGLKSVNFPGHSKKVMTRADVAFSSYRLTVPAWRALPPKSIPAAIIIMPDGSELTSAAYQKKLASKDPSVVAMLKTFLKSKDQKLVILAINAIPGLKLSEGKAMLIPMLKHKTPDVRKTVLRVLKDDETEEVLAAISNVMDRDRDKSVALAWNLSLSPPCYLLCRAASASAPMNKPGYINPIKIFNEWISRRCS